MVRTEGSGRVGGWEASRGAVRVGELRHRYRSGRMRRRGYEARRGRRGGRVLSIIGAHDSRRRGSVAKVGRRWRERSIEVALRLLRLVEAACLGLSEVGIMVEALLRRR